MDLDAYDNLIKELTAADREAVIDGPVVAEQYVKATPRILWLLREPNGGGGWDLRSFLATDQALFSYKRWWATFGLVAVVSHGLLNRCLPWGEWARDYRALTSALRQVAVLNVNKWGGAGRVNWDRLCRASLHFGPVLVRQIRLLDTQIVVLGGTFEVLPHELREPLRELEDMSMCAARAGGRIWFRGYHPNQTRITRQAYYEKLREEVFRLYSVA